MAWMMEGKVLNKSVKYFPSGTNICEIALTNARCRMDDVRTGNTFSLYPCPTTNHSG